MASAPESSAAWPDFMNFDQARRYSKIPRRELHRLLEEGEIHSRKFGKRRVIPKEAIIRYLTEEPALPENLLRRTARAR